MRLIGEIIYWLFYGLNWIQDHAGLLALLFTGLALLGGVIGWLCSEDRPWRKPP